MTDTERQQYAKFLREQTDDQLRIIERREVIQPIFSDEFRQRQSERLALIEEEKDRRGYATVPESIDSCGSQPAAGS